MSASKLWSVGSWLMLALTTVALLLFVWSVYLIGSSDIYCEGVYGVASLESTIYVRTIDQELNFRYFQSDDNGHSWQKANNIPQGLHNQLQRLSSTSTLLCNPTKAEICYRISSQDEFTELEHSINGGQLWKKMSIPVRLSTKRGCYSPTGPRSLTFVRSNTSNDSYILAVAVDTNGLLMLAPEGTWTQYSIDKLHGLD